MFGEMRLRNFVDLIGLNLMWMNIMMLGVHWCLELITWRPLRARKARPIIDHLDEGTIRHTLAEPVRYISYIQSL